MIYGRAARRERTSLSTPTRWQEARKLRRDVRRVKELVAKGLEAEPEYVELINELNPQMSAEERKKLIRQFRDAVYDQQPDLPGR